MGCETVGVDRIVGGEKKIVIKRKKKTRPAHFTIA